MTNVSKNKGTSLESALVKYLKERGSRGAMRPALKGKLDLGDVWDASPPHVAFECKAGAAAERASLNQIGLWIVEAITEHVNADAFAWVLVVKRKGTGLANMSHQRAFLEIDVRGTSFTIETTLQRAIDILQTQHIL